LSALEADGRGEVVSQPKVITGDKQQANIKSGTEVPYQEASASGETTTSFKEASTQKKQLHKVTAQAFQNYNDKSDAVDKGMEYRVVLDRVNQDKENLRIDNWFRKDATLTDIEVDQLNWMTATVSNAIPLPNVSERSALSDTKSPPYEVERRIWNSRVASLQQVVSDQITDRTALVEPDWIEGYAGDPSTDKISILESLSREIDGRLETPGWFQNVKQMPKSGLKREMNYLLAIENKLIYELVERINHKNRLLSLSLAKKLNEQRKEFEKDI